MGTLQVRSSLITLRLDSEAVRALPLGDYLRRAVAGSCSCPGAPSPSLGLED